MRIEVDLDLCQGHGMCELEAPRGLRDEDRPRRDPRRDSRRIPRAEVEAAVQYCPTQALRLTEDDE